MNIVEKRRATLINFVFYAFIIAAYYFFVKYAAWLIAPFIVAFGIAMFLQKPVRHISKKTKLNKKIIAAASVFLILAALVSIVVLVGYRIGVEFKGLWQYLIEKLHNLPEFIQSIESWIVSHLTILPDSLEKTAVNAINNFVDKLLLLLVEQKNTFGAADGGFDLSIITAPLGSLLSTAKQIPVFLTATLISIVACFFLTCDYDNFTKTIKKSMSEEHEKNLIKVKKLFGDILGKMFKSYATIILITFCEVAIGLNILKLFGIYKSGYIIAISLIIAIVDIFPVLGTGTILWPWAFISFITGNIGMGIGLIVIYAIISVLRQIIEPKLVSMNIGIHPVFTLMGMYLGAQLFGVLGIFILPITFFLVKALNDEGIIHLWGRNKN
ncbi:MAG: sporulation integral membrane protein YtvI [Clostridia bacterium]|nr:sporulation integral membrane protein YtvI [Clostridia bacterium]MBQ7122655.1 sporulation integral membrane protein YtvI [Clostridia bacterium]